MRRCFKQLARDSDIYATKKKRSHPRRSRESTRYQLKYFRDDQLGLARVIRLCVSGGEAYFSFWTYVPDDLLDRAIYIFSSHLDYTRVRMGMYYTRPSSHSLPRASAVLSYAPTRRRLHFSLPALLRLISVTHATKMRVETIVGALEMIYPRDLFADLTVGLRTRALN